MAGRQAGRRVFNKGDFKSSHFTEKLERFFGGFVFPDATKQAVRDLQIADGGWGASVRSSTDLVGSEMATTFHAHTVTPGVPFIRVTRRGNISGRVSPSAGSRRRALFPHCEGSTCAAHAHASPDLMRRYRDTGALIQSDGPVRAHYLSRQIVCASISLNSLVSRQRKGKQIKKSIDQ